MQRIKELMSRVQDLSDAELQELSGLVLSMVDENNKNKGKVFGEMEMEELSIVASASEAVRHELTRRDLNAQQRHQDEATLRQFASDALTVPTGREPHRSPLAAGGPAAVTASGHPVTHASELAGELPDAAHRMSLSSGADGDRTPVARVRWTRPADRILAHEHPNRVADLLASAAVEHAERVAQTLAEHPEAMVAAGGFATARQPLYDLPGFETSDRPVRAALPGFTVSRGGVTFTRPPTLASLNGATSIWTVQNDIDAATNPAIRKPAVRVLPGASVVADLQAIVSQIV